MIGDRYAPAEQAFDSLTGVVIVGKRSDHVLDITRTFLDVDRKAFHVAIVVF